MALLPRRRQPRSLRRGQRLREHHGGAEKLPALASKTSCGTATAATSRCSGTRRPSAGAMSPSLLLAVKSAPASFERRELSSRPHVGAGAQLRRAAVRRLFLLGTPHPGTRSAQGSWRAGGAGREHGDVLQ